jgi:hypothetical protein
MKDVSSEARPEPYRSVALSAVLQGSRSISSNADYHDTAV